MGRPRVELGIPPWLGDLDLWGRDVGGDGNLRVKCAFSLDRLQGEGSGQWSEARSQ